MTYENVLDIIYELGGSLKEYFQMLKVDAQIIKNCSSYKTICEPEEIVKNYIEELQDILNALTNSIQ